MRLVDKIAETDWPVFLTGETGTGKTTLAFEIHRVSDRRSGPFVPLDCSTLPDTLFESELFGFEKGSFTGATATRKGVFERANNGTLFLDEIGNLTPTNQMKLLTALENRSVRRLGGREIPVNVRLITATNGNVTELVRAKRFRPDLYYRLSSFTIPLPPLRDRADDIRELMTTHLNQAFGDLSKQAPDVPDELYDAFQRYRWPGNVRELQNTCKRIALLTDTPRIRVSTALSTLEQLPQWLDSTEAPDDEEKARDNDPLGSNGRRPTDAARKCPTCRELAELCDHDADAFDRSLTEMIEAVKKRVESLIIARVLEQTNGNKAEASRRLQINYKTLYYKIRTHGLDGSTASPHGTMQSWYGSCPH